MSNTKDYIKLNSIEVLNDNGVNIEFLDGIKIKNVPEHILKDVKNINVSPFTKDSNIYIYATDFSLKTDDKNRQIRVDVPPEVIKVLSGKILAEKWNCFTEIDSENDKRKGFFYNAHGEMYDDKIVSYSINLFYHAQSNGWNITIEKGYKTVEIIDNRKRVVKNSYKKIHSISIINISTMRITIWASKMKAFLNCMEMYSFPKYYDSRIETEKKMLRERKEQSK